MKIQSLSPVFQSKTPIYNSVKTNSSVNFTPIKDTVSFGKTQSSKQNELSESEKNEIIDKFTQKSEKLVSRLAVIQKRAEEVKRHANELKANAEELFKNGGMKDGIQVTTPLEKKPVGGYELSEKDNSSRYIFDEKGNLKTLIQNKEEGRTVYRFSDGELREFRKNEMIVPYRYKSYDERITYRPYTGNTHFYESGVTEYGINMWEDTSQLMSKKDESVEFSFVLGGPKVFVEGLQEYSSGSSYADTHARISSTGKPFEYSENWLKIKESRSWIKKPQYEVSKGTVVIFDFNGTPDRYGKNIKNITTSDTDYDVFNPVDYSNFTYLK